MVMVSAHRDIATSRHRDIAQQRSEKAMKRMERLSRLPLRRYIVKLAEDERVVFSVNGGTNIDIHHTSVNVELTPESLPSHSRVTPDLLLIYS